MLPTDSGSEDPLGWGLEQPGVVEGVPDHGRGGTLRSLPFWDDALFGEHKRSQTQLGAKRQLHYITYRRR